MMFGTQFFNYFLKSLGSKQMGSGSQSSEIHNLVKKSNGEVEELNFYLKSIKNSFNRLKIKELSQECIDLENEYSKLINSFTNTPCMIQIFYPDDSKEIECFQLLVLSMKQSTAQWRLFFREVACVRVRFSNNLAIFTFDQHSQDSGELSTLLETICARSNHLFSYKIQNKKSHFQVGLRLEKYISAKTSTERDTVL